MNVLDFLNLDDVHTEYLEAGAYILVTSSYQAPLPGFVSRGLSLKEAELLLENSVKLAVEARDKFWDSVKYTTGHRYNGALVAASIGSYGAYLADGSDYSGNYGPNITLENLKDFHRLRLQVLVAAGPDLLAFETIPNKLEAQACAELLEEENVEIPSWICFSSVDGVNAPSGESFKDCLDVLDKSDKVTAVGINCAPPHFVQSLIQRFKEDCKNKDVDLKSLNIRIDDKDVDLQELLLEILIGWGVTTILIAKIRTC